MQLVINGYYNNEKEIEAEILQGFLILSIFFFIYMSRILNKVSETSSFITSLSFINNLGFIDTGSSVNEIVKIFEKVA